MKILILASNPRKDLNLDREIRDLREVIEKSHKREKFEVFDALAVRVGDLQDLLFRHRPQIVHFCGHGSGQQGLVFEGNDGGEQWVRADALSDLFRLFSHNVGCVLLNACYSEEQANAIVNHIDYVVGMNQAVRDDAAIAFSKGFYRALGYECSVEEAFEFGKNAIQLEISGSSKVSRSATTEQRKLEVADAVAKVVIPEHLKPILKCRSALRQTEAPVVVGSEQVLSQAKRAEIQLDVAEALAEESGLKQYRDRVREFLADHQLSRFEEIRLEQLRKKLGLSVAEASRVLAEEQKPIQQARDEYEEMIIQLIEAGDYPFGSETKTNLQQLCQELQLTDAEVEAIEQPILEAAEEEYQEKLEQQKRQNQAATRKSFLKVFEFQVPTIGENLTITYRQGRAEYFVEEFGNGVILEMVAIPGGTFIMGSPDHELDRLDVEGPQHQVAIQSLFMGKFAVTQAQWKAVAALPKVNQDLDPDPSRFKGNNRPVEGVSWHDAIEFCDRLSQKTGKQYRLPSEAEWEYACRAGTTTPFYCGETITTDLANYDGNYTYGSGTKGVYREQTIDVGSFPPNGFGLYDMHGNVWEWCADHWHDNYQGAPIDGSAWIVGENSIFRLVRGGSWDVDPTGCRSACRSCCDPDFRDFFLGFRVVCVLA